jgi:microsomal dipeptidase-like Zn-dependent dipeptidase/anthranilate/para-aminobenzoate synthase component II
MVQFNWKDTYQSFHSTFPGYKKQPLIGLTGNFNDENCVLAETYYQSVLRAGGTPVILPPVEDKDALLSVLDSLDGILFTGGADLNPLYMGEEPIRELRGINPKRDLQELLLVRLAFDRQIPMLGICRGIQVMTAALDGSLYQDLYTQAITDESPLLKHNQDLARGYASHTVIIEKDTILYQIMQTEKLAVNSFHHQSVKDAGPYLKICAKAPDGIVEAVESSEYKPILGVQWHPECFLSSGDNSMMPIFEWLVKESLLFKKTKTLHREIITLDSHCDTPMFFGKNIHFEQRDPRILVDLHKMTEGHLDATCMVAYLEQKERTPEALKAATAKANRILNEIEKLVEHNCSVIDIAKTPEDIVKLKAQGKKSIMLGIENGYAVGKDISNLKKFRDRGVVYMTLCHNGDNDICDSHKGNQEHGGVSEFGAQVIEEMNRLGMMVDLSHAHEKSFYDALEISHLPIVCSHSSSRALCNHTRNLTDEQLKALAKKGGVAQVTLYNYFLREDGKATILDAIEHLNHMVNVMGIDHVGIGTDFDGDGGILGCSCASELLQFTRRLLMERYNKEDIQKIWGGNFLRIMRMYQNQ